MPFHRSGGLAARLAGALGVALTLLLAGLFWFDFRESASLLEDSLAAQARATALAGALRVNAVCRAVERAVLSLANSSSMGASLESNALSACLQGTLEANEEMEAFSLLLLSEDGTVSQSISFGRKNGHIQPLPFSELVDTPEERIWERTLPHLISPRWLEPFRDHGGRGEMTSTFSAPFFRKGKERGAFAGQLSFAWLDTFLGEIRPHNAEGVMLFSLSGKLLAQNFATGAADRWLPLLSPSSSPLPSDENGFFALGPPDGGQKQGFAFFSSVRSTGWRFVVLFDRQTAITPFVELARLEVLLVAFGLLAMLLILFFVIRFYLSPLRALALSATEIARGNLLSPVALPHQNSEITDLAAAFEKMRLDLDRYIKELESRVAERERFESELRIARTIQTSMLPSQEFSLGSLRGFALLEPAREVGGDFYEYFPLADGSLFVAVGDVSGKGIPAAIFMAECCTLIRALAPHCEGPATFLSQLNEALAIRNDACMFVTLCCLFIDPGNGYCRYANAGHPLPLLRRANGSIDVLPAVQGSLAGVLSPLHFEEGTLALEAGATMLLFTDGVTEAENPTGLFFTEDRLIQGFSTLQDEIGPSIIRSLRAIISEHVGSAVQTDDLTLLALSRASEKGGLTHEQG